MRSDWWQPHKLPLEGCSARANDRAVCMHEAFRRLVPFKTTITKEYTEPVAPRRLLGSRCPLFFVGKPLNSCLSPTTSSNSPVSLFRMLYALGGHRLGLRCIRDSADHYGRSLFYIARSALQRWNRDGTHPEVPGWSLTLEDLATAKTTA